jgi:hypothetical protein
MNNRDKITLAILVILALFFTIGWDFLAENSLGVIFLLIISSVYAFKAYYQRQISRRTWFMGTVAHVALMWMIADHLPIVTDKYVAEEEALRLTVKIVGTSALETGVCLLYWKAFRIGCRVRQLLLRMTT